MSINLGPVLRPDYKVLKTNLVNLFTNARKVCDRKMESSDDIIFLKYDKLISRGGYGKIYEACIKKNNPDCSYIAKVIGINGVTLKMFQMEAEIAKFAGEQGFGPRVTEAYICSGGGVIIMDKWDGAVDSLSKTVIVENIIQIFNLFDAMHSSGILHGDLFAKNMLFRKNNDGTYSFCVTDFGMSIPLGKPVPVQLRLTDFASFVFGFLSDNSLREGLKLGDKTKQVLVRSIINRFEPAYQKLKQNLRQIEDEIKQVNLEKSQISQTKRVRLSKSLEELEEDHRILSLNIRNFQGNPKLFLNAVHMKVNLNATLENVYTPNSIVASYIDLYKLIFLNLPSDYICFMNRSLMYTGPWVNGATNVKDEGKEFQFLVDDHLLANRCFDYISDKRIPLFGELLKG